LFSNLYYVWVNKLAFFLVAHCLIFYHNQPFRLGRGGMHMAGGDAHASCALGGFNVSNLMGITRRMIDIGKKNFFS
jgi:hypothetical protein